MYEYRLRKLRNQNIKISQTLNFEELRKFADISKILNPNFQNLIFMSNGYLHFYCHLDIPIEEFLQKIKEKLSTKGGFYLFHKNELTCYQHELEDRLKIEEIELKNKKELLNQIKIDRELDLIGR
jgi:hypothetical protein